MIFLLQADGTIAKLYPERVYQGAVGVDIIEVLAPFADTTSLTMQLELPNGETSPAYRMVLNRIDAPQEATCTFGLNLWTATLDAYLTQYAGDVKISIRAYDGEKIITTGTALFPIAPHVPGDLPPIPPPDVYDLILQQISNLYATKLDRVGDTSTDQSLEGNIKMNGTLTVGLDVAGSLDLRDTDVRVHYATQNGQPIPLEQYREITPINPPNEGSQVGASTVNVTVTDWQGDAAPYYIEIFSAEFNPDAPHVHYVGMTPLIGVNTFSVEGETQYNGIPVTILSDSNGTVRVQCNVKWVGTIRLDGGVVESSGGTVDEVARQQIANEVTRATAAEEALDGKVTALTTDLDGKLDKETVATTYPQIYGKTATGQNGLYNMSTALAYGSIIQRSIGALGGTAEINDPNNDLDIANKRYVDNVAENLQQQIDDLDIGIDTPNHILKVDNSYTGDTENGTIAHPFKTITAALNAATQSTRIDIAPGTYTENIQMSGMQNIRLVSETAVAGQYDVVINGTLDVTGAFSSLGFANLSFYGQVTFTRTTTTANGPVYFDNCAFRAVSFAVNGTLSGNNYIKFQNNCEFQGDVSLQGPYFIDIRNSQFESNAVITQNYTQSMLNIQDTDYVSVRHTNGIYISRGTVQYTASSALDGFCMVSTATATSESILYLLGGSTLGTNQQYAAINKSGDCSYRIGIFVHEPTLDSNNWQGVRLDGGLHGEDIYCHQTTSNFTPTNTRLSGYFEGIDNALAASRMRAMGVTNLYMHNLMFSVDEPIGKVMCSIISANGEPFTLNSFTEYILARTPMNIVASAIALPGIVYKMEKQNSVDLDSKIISLNYIRFSGEFGSANLIAVEDTVYQV